MAEPTQGANFLMGADTAAPAQVGRSALGVRGMEAPAQRDALSTAEGLTNVQRNMLEIQQVQAGLEAKKIAGQIMASAPNFDAGIAALESNPQVAGFAPDIIATLQSVSNAQTEQAGMEQVQATSGLSAVFAGLLPAVNDPGMFDRIVEAQSKVLSPSAQAALQEALPGIKVALFDGLEKLSPEAAGAEYQQRLGALIVGSGFSPDGVRAVTGALAPQVVSIIGPDGEPMTIEIGGPITETDGGPDIIGIGPGSAEQARLTSEGALAASVQEDMSLAAMQFPKLITTMDHIVEALGQVQTGGGADIRANLGKTLQFFQQAGMEGLSDELIDKVANGNLAATQTLAGFLRTFVTEQLRTAAAGTGAGQVSAEVQAFLQMADETTDTQALLNFANQARDQLRIAYDQSQSYPEFKRLYDEGDPTARAYGLHGYYAWYNAQRFNREALPGETPAGTDLTIPKSEEELRGEPGDKPSGNKATLEEIFR